MAETLFSIGSLPVTNWALCVTLGSLAGVLVIWYLSIKRKINGDAAALLVPLTVFSSVLLGHGLFAVLSCLLDPYVQETVGASLLGYVFRPDKGGYMGLGVLGGLFLSALIVSRIKKVSFQELLKAGLPGVLLAIGVAKWGEWLCGQGTGPEAATCFFPVSFLPEPDYPDWRVISVFWLGGLFAVCLALWGIIGAHRKDGVRPVMLLVCYLSGQVLWDMLREDSYIHYLAMNFIRMDQLFSVLVLTGLMIWATVRIRPGVPKGMIGKTALLLAGILLLVGGLVLQGRELPAVGVLPGWVLIVLMAVGAAAAVLAVLMLCKVRGTGVFRWWALMLISVGLCVAMQFMFDKPLPLFGELIYFPGWLVYALIGVTGVLMGLSTLMLLKLARKKA